MGPRGRLPWQAAPVYTSLSQHAVPSRCFCLCAGGRGAHARPTPCRPQASQDAGGAGKTRLCCCVSPAVQRNDCAVAFSSLLSNATQAGAIDSLVLGDGLERRG